MKTGFLNTLTASFGDENRCPCNLFLTFRHKKNSLDTECRRNRGRMFKWPIVSAERLPANGCVSLYVPLKLLLLHD